MLLIYKNAIVFNILITCPETFLNSLPSCSGWPCGFLLPAFTKLQMTMHHTLSVNKVLHLPFSIHRPVAPNPCFSPLRTKSSSEMVYKTAGKEHTFSFPISAFHH